MQGKRGFHTERGSEEKRDVGREAVILVRKVEGIQRAAYRCIAREESLQSTAASAHEVMACSIPAKK